jgi:hypothetical protein
MKNRILAAGAAVLVLSGVAAQAEVLYAPNFNDFSRNLRLTQQDSWLTNDPYVASETAGETALLQLITGYSDPVGSENWAMLGGFSLPDGQEPGVFSPSASRLFSNTVSALNNTLRFEVDMAILSSTNGKRDEFSWVFKSADQSTTFFRLGFIPLLDPQLADFLDMRIYTAANPAGFSSTAYFSYDSDARVTVDVNLADAVRDAVTVRVTDLQNVTETVFNNVTVPNNTASGVQRIAAQWDIKDPAVDANQNPSAYGTNAMIFDNYSVSAVPEPGTAALLLGGFALLGLRRKRA